uniref:Uncharacterized protein n=1 Tax=Podoviridae sp. ctz6O13 TaxID=2827757 RepID=A0A8S5TLT4_9CAUD|nr:MAG TPA: hypothetical protein [Podoviridae sp. ctz6O13]
MVTKYFFHNRLCLNKGLKIPSIPHVSTCNKIMLTWLHSSPIVCTLPC